MITISQELNTEFTEMLEDCVEYITTEYYTQGELVSGQTLYKMMEAFALAKLAQFDGECV